MARQGRQHIIDLACHARELSLRSTEAKGHDIHCNCEECRKVRMVAYDQLKAEGVIDRLVAEAKEDPHNGWR